MGTKLYVGNLPFDLSKEELLEMFAEVGPVADIKFVCDSFDGRFRGYGFVEMAMDQDVDKAIERFNGHQVKGRSIRVASAHSNDRNGASTL